MSDYVAQFLAKGGKIQTVAEGEGLNLSPRDWHKINTGECTQYARGASERARLETENAAERERELFQDARMTGSTVEEAYEYAQRGKYNR